MAYITRQGIGSFAFGQPETIPVSEILRKINSYNSGPLNLGQPAVSRAQFPAPELTVFPNIDAKMPHLSKAAADSAAAVKNLAWFNDVYRDLAQATSNSTLALDNQDRILVIPSEMTSVEKLAPKLVNSVVKKLGLKVVGELAGKSIANVLGLMPILMDLLVALTANERKNLVSEQRHSRYQEAFRFKLRFYIRLWLSDNSIGGPGTDPNKQAWVLENLFFKYQQVLGEWWKYLDIEKNLKQGLNPNQRQAPVMRPA